MALKTSREPSMYIMILMNALSDCIDWALIEMLLLSIAYGIARFWLS